MDNTQTIIEANPDLLSELLDDILRPSFEPTTACLNHGLKMAELAAVLESESFQQLLHDHARAAAVHAEIQRRRNHLDATATLAEIATSEHASPETRRKAASTLLRLAAADARSTRSANHPDRPRAPAKAPRETRRKHHQQAHISSAARASVADIGIALTCRPLFAQSGTRRSGTPRPWRRATVPVHPNPQRQPSSIHHGHHATSPVSSPNAHADQLLRSRLIL